MAQTSTTQPSRAKRRGAVSEDLPKFTKRHHQAASLLAEDELSDEAIAQQVGVSRQALWLWKQKPEFAALVGDYVGKLQAGMLKLAIAKKRKRVARLDEMERRLWQIVEERAADAAERAATASPSDSIMRGIFPGTDDTPPGAGTGLVTKTLKQIGAGRNAQMIEEYGVATGVVSEIMALHKQAATELGQWVEKSASDVTTNMVQIVGIEDDDL